MTDIRVTEFAKLLAAADTDERKALIAKANMLAMNEADHDALPVLLSRDEWNAEISRRRSAASALVAKGYEDRVERLLDTDANALAAREALQLRIVTELGIGREEALSLLTSVLAVSGRKIGRTAAELLAEVAEQTDYLVPDMIGKGWAVKIAGREKGGKGTLIFYLLSRLERKEKTVFGQAYSEPVTSLICTEEPQDALREKIANFGLKDATIIYGHEVAGMEWPERCRFLVARATEDGHGIVFQDNISRAARVEDEAGTELARAAEVLSDECKAAGLTLIIDHHHKKGSASVEDKSRGGTALSGMTDNNIEIVRSGDVTSRFRKITSVGRMSGSIWERRIALDDDGRGYTLVADDDEPQDAAGRDRLDKLRDAGEPGVTAPEFAELIDASDDTARRVLNQWVEGGMATMDDSTRPARYWHSSVDREGELNI